MKKQIESAKNFVARNQTKILITTTVVATSAAMLMRVGISQHNEFLKERNLYEEFYAQTDDEW